MIEQIQLKSMAKFFNKFKKPYFWFISLVFRAKNIFQNVWLCHAQFQMGLEHHLKIQKKTNDPVLSKWLDRRKDERANGRTGRPYFKGPLWLPPESKKIRFEVSRQICIYKLQSQNPLSPTINKHTVKGIEENLHKF